MINNVPILELQKSIYDLFSRAITGYEIVDDSSPLLDGQIPGGKFGIIGAITAMPTTTKIDTVIWNATVSIELYSNYRGKKEINEMANDVSYVLTAGKFLMNNFNELSCTIEDVECRAEDWEDGTLWQHGTVRAVFKLEQKEV